MTFNLDYWILQTLAMLVTALLLPGLKVSGPIGAFLTVISIAFINAHAWDAALFFSIPDALTSEVFMLLLANGAIFWVLVKILPGIEIDGFLPALFAPIIFTFSSLIIRHYLSNVDWLDLLGQLYSWILELKVYFLNSQSNHG